MFMFVVPDNRLSRCRLSTCSRKLSLKQLSVLPNRSLSVGLSSKYLHTLYVFVVCFSFRKWDTKAYRMTVDGTHWTSSQPNNLPNAPGFTEVKEERTNIYIEMSVKFRWMALHMKISLFSWEIRMQNSRQWTHCALCWSVWFYLQIRFN